jgi:hypothetical protein
LRQAAHGTQAICVKRTPDGWVDATGGVLFFAYGLRQADGLALQDYARFRTFPHISKPVCVEIRIFKITSFPKSLPPGSSLQTWNNRGFFLVPVGRRKAVRPVSPTWLQAKKPAGEWHWR